MNNLYIKFSLLIFSLCLLSGSLLAKDNEIKKGETQYEENYSPEGNLKVKGTLIVSGDLTMPKGKDLKIEKKGILIVLGTLTIGKKVEVAEEKEKDPHGKKEKVKGKDSGYLIAEKVYVPQNGGEFKKGNKDNVYINDVTVKSDNFDNLKVLKPGGHEKINDLKAKALDIWRVYDKAEAARKSTGGTIKINGSSNSCLGTLLPFIKGDISASKQYKFYSWEYSPDPIKWEVLVGKNGEDLGSINLASIDPKLGAGTYSFRRIATKENNNDPKYSNVVEIIVNPLPADAGNITGDAVVVKEASGSYEVPLITNADSYEWLYSGDGASITNNGNEITIDFATNATSGDLTVSGTNGSCSGQASQPFSITVKSGTTAAPEITAIGAQSICADDGPISIVESISVKSGTPLVSMSVQIADGYVLGEDKLVLSTGISGISESWDENKGMLSLTGTNSTNLTQFENAIKNVEFTNLTSPRTSGARTFSITLENANYLPGTDHFYEFVPDVGVSWTQARDKAAAKTYYGLKGYLATLTSEEEAVFAGSKIVGSGSVGAGWIGASDAAREGDWKWVTGPEAGTLFWTGTANGVPSGYSKWNMNTVKSEPNDSPNNRYHSENYAHITDPNPTLNNVKWGWNDLPNAGGSGQYRPQGYVVEYGGFTTDPPLSISASTTIAVGDTEAPVINGMPADMIITNCNQVVNWTEPTAIDRCGPVALTSDQDPGKLFPSGESVVTYTAKNGAGSNTVNFKVTVQDDLQAPLLCFDADNHALGKTAIQSSLYSSAVASRAIDGNINGVYNNNSVTHTQNSPQEWWQVDLGSEEKVDYVNIYRRTDCCNGRLVNFYVLLSNNDLQSVSLTNALKDPTVESYYVAGDPGDLKRILTSGNVFRYVKIQLKGTDHLSLAEVEVMGCTSQTKDDITIPAESGKCTAQATWDMPSAIDNCGTVTLSSNYNSGDDFPVGTTKVTYTVTDGMLTTTQSFNVIVTDDDDPVAVCQDIQISLNEQGHFTITSDMIDNGSTDNCGIVSRELDKEDFSVADVGQNTVRLTVTDVNGNSDFCDATVTIVDDAPSTASIEINTQDASIGSIPDSLVQNVLVTGCLIAENVDYTGDQTNGIGYFEKGDSDFPLSSGVILSTGNVENAIGPASNFRSDQNTGFDFIENNQDSDLVALAGTEYVYKRWWNGSNYYWGWGWDKAYYDTQILEFDFIPAGNKLEFNYIFASEEYNGYACSDFNDGFAFILSGPGIDNDTGLSGQNIALTENGDQVSINNVYKNQCEDCPDNSEFYVEEIGGHSIAFDGRTKILNAKADVTSCETYHIKLIVYDRNDKSYNSAVFLEAKSFKSNEVIVENRIDGIDGDKEVMYRGCDKSYISFSRKEGIDEEYPFHITIGGKAQNGIDYYQVTEDGTKIGDFPEDVSFAKGETEIKIFYMASDEVSGSKDILFEVLRGCPCSTDDDDYFRKSIDIIDVARIEAEAISNVTCGEGDPVSTIIIKLAGDLNSKDYLYAMDGGSFQKQNMFQGFYTVGDHIVTIKDKFSCGSEDITIDIPEATDLKANAGIDFEMCEKDSKTLNGTGGIDYLWTCDKPAGLDDMNVTSSTPNISPDLPADMYTYTLTVSDGLSGLCESSADVVVTVKPTPVINSIDASELEVCSGQAINLTASVSNVNTPSYKWTPDAEINGSSEGLSVTVQPTSTVLAPRTFTFTVTEDICSASQSISGIKVNPNPTVSLNDIESNLCSNGSNGEISVTATGGTPMLSAPEYTYSWSPNSGSSNIATALAPNLYTVTVIDSKSCEAKLDVKVHAQPKPIGIFFE